MTAPSAILDALGSVRDPELDTSIVELGFVTGCWLDDVGTAHVRLRLPTYFCAPNFAYLMVADAHDAVVGVDGVEAVDIALEDHFAADEINVGVAARAGFVASFDGLAEHELGDLRRTFLRKAALAAQDRVVRPLVAAGLRPTSSPRSPSATSHRLLIVTDSARAEKSSGSRRATMILSSSTSTAPR